MFFFFFLFLCNSYYQKKKTLWYWLFLSMRKDIFPCVQVYVYVFQRCFEFVPYKTHIPCEAIPWQAYLLCCCLCWSVKPRWSQCLISGSESRVTRLVYLRFISRLPGSHISWSASESIFMDQLKKKEKERQSWVSGLKEDGLRQCWVRPSGLGKKSIPKCLGSEIRNYRTHI